MKLSLLRKEGLRMRRSASLLVFLLLIVFTTTGCGRRRSKDTSDDVSHKPVDVSKPADDRSGFDLGPSNSDTRFTERDIPMGERPTDIKEYKDPFANTGVSLSTQDSNGAENSEEDLASVFRDIHFAFDRYKLSDDAQKTLSEIGALMLSRMELKVVVEGHCDGRGASSYNLALGERRALAVREFLVAMGVDALRLHTVSYGEEYPLAPGNDETAWARNRRAHFRVKD